MLAVGALRTGDPQGNQDRQADHLPAWLQDAPQLLAPGGRLVAIDARPSGATRLADTLQGAGGGVDPNLRAVLSAAEDALAAARDTVGDEALATLLQAAGFERVHVTSFEVQTRRVATPARVASWFEAGHPLRRALGEQGASDRDVEALHVALTAAWQAGVTWRTPWRQVTASTPGGT
jgi:hypothetical protein